MIRKCIRQVTVPPAAILILLFFNYTACEEYSSKQQLQQTFSLEQAKYYYEGQAKDMRLPSASQNLKSSIDYDEILIPQWDKTEYYEFEWPRKTAYTYEIPLNTGTIIDGVLMKTDTISPYSQGKTKIINAIMSCSLIVQEFIQKNMIHPCKRQMIVTIIGNDSRGNNSSMAFRYGGSRKSFTGFMIVSTLSGKIVNIFEYVNGRRSTVYVKYTTDQPYNNNHKGFCFIKSNGTKSSYGYGENGMCYLCGKEGIVFPQYGYLCQECLNDTELLDGIVVTPKPDDCMDCGYPKDQCECNPFACDVCGKEPCECNGEYTKCDNCGKEGCNGECIDESGNLGSTTPGEAEGEWWEGGHNKIIIDALSNYLTSIQIESVQEGSAEADSEENQELNDSHMHAMLEPGLTYEEGVAKMKSYFIEKMQLFTSNSDYFSLGMGLHCIQDAYSPPHAFQYWEGDIMAWVTHLFESIYIYPGEAKEAMNATESIYMNIIKSDGSKEQIGEIFDNWLNEYENH